MSVMIDSRTRSLNVCCGALLAIGCALLLAQQAQAYAILVDFSWGGVTSTHETAARWSSLSGLSDGIQVGVEPGFAEQMGAVTPVQVEALRERVRAAFQVWETEVLRFDVTFDAEVTADDPLTGYEIDLIAVTEEEFPPVAGVYGYAQTSWEWFDERPLTNGQVFPGYAIVGVDIYLDRDQIDLQLSSYGPLGLDAFQRLVSHEIGHAIGLGHPNENEPFLFHSNYDTDMDPENPMLIDPADPFADLLVSPNRNNLALMSNRHCGPDAPISEICAESFDTTLSNDDRGGRDVFYPLPEPPRPLTTVLVVTALELLARRRARPTREQPSRHGIG